MKLTKPRNNAAIKDTECFAIGRHEDQPYGKRPYEFHLRQVAMALDEMGADDEEVQAGWVHDVLEDTGTTHAQLTEMFGQRVADLAWAVTGVGDTREEKLASVLKKIPTVPGSEKVKLADRYCNVRMCLRDKHWKKLKTYVLEHPALSAILPPATHPLRQDLDRLIRQGRDLLIGRGELYGTEQTFTDRFMDTIEAMCTARPPEDLCQGWLFGKDDERLQDWVLQHLRFEWMSGIGVIEAAQHAAENCEEGRNDLPTKEEDEKTYRQQARRSTIDASL